MNTALSQSLQKAQNLYRSGDVSAAIQQCQKAIKRFSKYAEPWLLLANIQQSQGRIDVALDALEMACQKTPDNLSLKLQYADACMQLGKYSRASIVCREGMRQQPKDTAWGMRLAAALQESEKPIEEAITIYHKIALANPNEAVVYYNLGTALKRQHNFEETVAAYRHAVAIAPKDIDYRMSLCNMLFEMTKFDEAVIECEKLLAVKADIPEALGILYYSHKKLSNFDESLSCAQLLVKATGQTSESMSALASAQIAVKNYHEAVVSCDIALDKEPTHRRVLADKTIALSFSDKKPEAKKLFDIENLLYISQIDVPEGYDNVAQFNQALVNHVKSHPTLRFDGLNHTCLGGATSNEIFVSPLGPVEHLKERIFSAVDSYRESLISDSSHPWLSNLPDQTVLNLSGWVTRLRTQGYQQGHIHPTAWISGVYYVNLPPIDSDNPDSGGIEFGRAPSYYPDGGDQGEVKVIRPEGGTLVLFPSYFYHRTIPFKASAERFTLAFDFRTKEFS
jgi:tetratricopeptide (TPR) repeat protein